MTADEDHDAGHDQGQSTDATWREPLGETIGRFLPFLLGAAAVFVLAAVLGYAAVGRDAAEQVTLADGSQSLSAVEYAVNNFGSVLVLAGGMGIGTLWMLLRNGANFGAALKVGLLKGVSPVALAESLLPHGIFEIPALIVAGAVGLFLPWRALQYLRGNRETIATPEDERHLLQLGVLVVVGILVGAVVEAHVTPPIQAG